METGKNRGHAPDLAGNLNFLRFFDQITVEILGILEYNDSRMKEEGQNVLNIVLVEPEIPQNCGNIARTCAATRSRLHLIRPLATTKAPRDYSQAQFSPDCWLMFGKETAGLPEWLREKYRSRCIRIPMREDARSLNLANSVAVLTYEALKQNGFPRLSGACSMAAEE